ncbi:hypothetical protein GWI33_017111 [Rhynchophorus ferrugineus]|uniref:Cadherin domain-containing protein n=1 Tax=Rhynchophorus ferrugineus TaxID=354439 RepID=A0A834HZR3_RHYFE|nr:hypothetical protein GWI33_017111 [Rhynchophorus ferrugineus]
MYRHELDETTKARENNLISIRFHQPNIFRFFFSSAVTKFIRIGIADKNDNPPYFDKALYEAEVDENEDIQHTVLTVTAKDHDESSRIRYEITSGNIGGAFAVKNMTGAIYVAGALDYETRKRYELRLAASDNLKENYTTVVIHVKDVNDNPPVFERPTYRTQITEEDDRNLPKSVLRASVSPSLPPNQTGIDSRPLVSKFVVYSVFLKPSFYALSR